MGGHLSWAETPGATTQPGPCLLVEMQTSGEKLFLNSLRSARMNILPQSQFLVCSLVNSGAKTFRPAIVFLYSAGRVMNFDIDQRRPHFGTLMRPDISEFVMVAVELLLGSRRFVGCFIRRPLQLFFRCGVALAVLIHHGRRFGFNPLGRNFVDFIGHDSLSVEIRCGRRGPQMHARTRGEWQQMRQLTQLIRRRGRDAAHPHSRIGPAP
jgi:hypothetical protein